MKKLFLLFSAFFSFAAFAQDFQFDYMLEYTDGDGNPFSYYINSKNSNYVFRDGDYHTVVTNEFMMYFSVSLAGNTRIYDVIPDEMEINTTNVETLGTDKSETTINGFKCRKYTYKTMVTNPNDETTKIQVTYVAHIMPNSINTAETLDKNEVVFPESIVYGKLPPGTIVQFESLGDEEFDGYIQMSLKKITKLEKPLVLDITTAQVTKFLLNNQER